MPKVPFDYSNTYFYKIVSKDPDNLNMYIGHTTNFTKRKHKHKGCCLNENNTHHNLPLYQHIRLNGGWENWDMVLIDKIKCENFLDARAKEREIFDIMKPSLNAVRPFVSEEELIEHRRNYYNENVETIKPKRQEYRDTHREQINQTNKEYRDNNKEKIKVKQANYYKENANKVKQKVKEYAEKNKDKIKERGVNYREKNKEIIQQRKKEYREKNSEIINCQCGKSFKKYNLLCHNKSQKHQQYLQSLV